MLTLKTDSLSLVPVAVGYAIAHYIGMAVFRGQQLLIQLSDPLDRGWNLFGKADDYVDYRVVSPTVMAAIQALGMGGRPSCRGDRRARPCPRDPP